MRQTPTNIIFIVLDTAGAKHMSLYGYPRQTTPNLEKIAADCRVYTRCFAPGCWTIPSHGSMFTGLYPSQHGACEGRFMLSDNVHHLVSALNMAGYQTNGISSNGLVTPATGLCGDFDEFTDFGNDDLNLFMSMLDTRASEGTDELGARLKKALTMREVLGICLTYLFKARHWLTSMKTGMNLVKKLLAKMSRPSPLTKSSKYSEKTIKLFQSVINHYSHDTNAPPFFLFINLIEAHQTYRPPLRWRRFSQWFDKAWVDPQRFYRRSDIDNIQSLVEKYRNLYDDEILYLDSIVGRIWNIYRNSKLFDNTVFIITSDHGEHLGEKGHYTHILSLYNELLWVPLIVRYPHGLGDIGVDNRMVSLNDLYPTILDLIDSPLPRPETCYSLLSDVRRELAVAQLVLPEMYRVQLQAKQEVSKVQGGRFSPPLFAVMTDDGLKVIEKQDGDLEIFNLAQDRDEENNLVSDLSPEIMENFRHLIHVLKEETGYDARREEILNYSDKGKGCL